MKQSILVLSDWFAPAYKAGGIITACKNFALRMSKEQKVFVLTSCTDLNNEPLEGITPDRWSLFEQNCFVQYATPKKVTPGMIRRAVKALNPECIYLNSMFSLRFTIFVLLLKWLGQIKCPVVLSTHGMMLPEALKNKGLKKKVFLSFIKWTGLARKITFQTNMTEEYDNIKKVLNPVSVQVTPQPLYTAVKNTPFQLPEKAPGYLSLAFLGRIHPVKNLCFALEVLKELPYDIEFRIIGAVEDKPYWEQCRSLITDLPPNIHIKQYGALPQEDAERIMKESHALFLPSKTENFCFAVYEALSNGRPVIISDRTPWRNLDAVGAGWDIALDQPAQFRNVIEKMVMMSKNEYQAHAKGAWEFAERYSENINALLTAKPAETMEPKQKIA